MEQLTFRQAGIEKQECGGAQVAGVNGLVCKRAGLGGEIMMFQIINDLSYGLSHISYEPFITRHVLSP